MKKFIIEYWRDEKKFSATIFEEDEEAAMHKFKEYYLYHDIISIV
jgi:hypothetical protein